MEGLLRSLSLSFDLSSDLLEFTSVPPLYPYIFGCNDGGTLSCDFMLLDSDGTARMRLQGVNPQGRQNGVWGFASPL